VKLHTSEKEKKNLHETAQLSTASALETFRKQKATINTLEQEKTSSQQTIERLNSQLQKLQEEQQAAAEKFSKADGLDAKAKQEIENLRQQLRSKEKNHADEVQAFNDSASSAKLTQERLAAERTQDAAELQKKYEKVKSEFDSLEMKEQQARDRVAGLQKSSGVEKDDLEQQIHDLKRKSQQLQEQLDAESADKTAAAKKHTQKLEEMAASTLEQTSRLTKQTAQLKKELAEAESKLLDAQALSSSTAASAKDKQGAVEIQLKAEQSQVSKLQEEKQADAVLLQSARASTEILQTQINDLESERAGLKAGLKAANDALAASGDQNAQKREKAESRVRELDDQVNSLTTSASGLEVEVKRLTDTQSALQKDINQQKQQHRLAQEELKREKEALSEELATERENAAAANASSAEELRAAQDTALQLQQQVAALNSSLEKAKRNAGPSVLVNVPSSVDPEKNALNRTITLLQSQLRAKEEELVQEQTSLQVLSMKIGTESESFAAEQQKLTAAQDKERKELQLRVRQLTTQLVLEQLKSSHAAAAAASSDSMSDDGEDNKDAQIASLQLQLDDARAALAAKRRGQPHPLASPPANVDILRAEIAALNIQVDALQKQLQKANADLQAATREVKTLKKQLANPKRNSSASESEEDTHYQRRSLVTDKRSAAEVQAATLKTVAALQSQ